MSTPTDPLQDELRSLRERAYGPDADIQLDPTAMARLQELEALEQAERALARSRPAEADARAAWSASAEPASAGALGAGVPDAATGAASGARSFSTPAPEGRYTDAGSVPPDSDAAPLAREGATGGSDDSAAAEDGSAGPSDASAEDATSARRWWRRRIPLLWAGSVVAAMLVGVGLTLAAQVVGAGQVAVLPSDPDADWPEQFFGSAPPENSQVFEEFHGLTILATPQGLSGTDALCLYTINTVGGGFLGGSCGAGSFPATAALVVGAESPRELRDRFADGTSLKFVLDGNQVLVYSAAPAPGATP